MKVRNREEASKSELQMTSMIDVVFLLLIFFILTFKIVENEGDFMVKMPVPGKGPSEPEPEVDMLFKLRLHADAKGSLAKIQLDELDLGTDFEQLRSKMVSLVDNTQSPDNSDKGPQVEIDTDYNLRYEYVIRAITHVSGYKQDGKIHKLIQRLKFAPPRR